jgi:MoaA/NifB/PqqE/SkfB family radical SAM enzyme
MVGHHQENEMNLSLYTRKLKMRFSSRGFQGSSRLAMFKFTQLVEHSTPIKLINLMLTKVSKLLKLERLISMPQRYVIDPINYCNLRCPVCPTGLGILGRERSRMSLPDFEKLIDQIVNYAYMVELYNWGEPFLHPQIFDIIRYASARRIGVRLSSNFNHFNAEMAEKTVASGLDAINISVDGADQETYEKYRRGGKLEKVLKNIRLLVEAKRKAGSSKPFITLRTVVNRYNEAQIDELRELAQTLGVDMFFAAQIYIDTTNPEQAREWLPVKPQNSFYDIKNGKLENVWACAELWESITINPDGGISPCCWLHQKKNDYENAFARPLKEIWNGDAYISSRRVFAFGGPKAGPVQTICTVCKGRPQYLKD